MNKKEASITVQKNGNLVFHISEKRLGVEIGFQFFVIKPVDQYRVTDVKKMRQRILDGQINSIIDFYHYAKQKVTLVYTSKTGFYNACEQLDAIKTAA